MDDWQDDCWFCHKTDCDTFDSEFDTYLHLSCLERVLKEDPTHAEAVVMKWIVIDNEERFYKDLKVMMMRAQLMDIWVEFDDKWLTFRTPYFFDKEEKTWDGYSWCKAEGNLEEEDDEW